MARRRRTARTRRRAPSLGLTPGECGVTKRGQPYCYIPGVGVRFQPRGSYGGYEYFGELANPGRKRVCVSKKRVRSRSGKMVTRCARFSTTGY
jgi:hypothetical protein